MPISIQSKKTIESKAAPGVTFTVRTLNRIQRAKRDLGVMEIRQRMSALLKEYGSLGGGLKEGMISQLEKKNADLSAALADCADDVTAAATRSAIDSNAAAIESLKEQIRQVSPEQRERLLAIDVEFEWLQDSAIKPAFLRAGLAAIEGLLIDEKPATVESLITSSGPDNDALIDEMYRECQIASGLSPAEIKNSGSGSTSSAPVDPASPASSVTSAVG